MPGLYGSASIAPPPAPTFVSHSSTGYTQDNSVATFVTPIVNYSSLSVAGTACQSGHPPMASGMPCSGSSIFAALTDWYQGFFVAPTAADLNGTQNKLFIADGGSGMSVACGGGNARCWYINGSPSLSNFFGMNLESGSVFFWPAACPSINATGVQIFPEHRYLILFGTVNSGYPFLAVVDATAGTVLLNQTCTATGTPIWGSGTWMGTGSSATLTSRTTFTDFGAGATLPATWKNGFDGQVGPWFAFVDEFPNAAGVLNSAELLGIAAGTVNIGPAVGCTTACPGNPPGGGTMQAWYPMDYTSSGPNCVDEGPYTYTPLTFNGAACTTGNGVGGPTILAAPYITIQERQAGFTFRLDQPTIIPNAAEQACYAGAPATGTVYGNGTLAADGSYTASGVTLGVYNSSGTLVASAPATVNGSTWSGHVSGIPWGTGYTMAAWWTNSSARIYRSKQPFGVGALFLVDGQSEPDFMSLGSQSGQDVAISSAASGIGSVITTPPILLGAVTPSVDEAPWADDLRIINVANTPGVSQPLWSYLAQTVGTANGDAMFLNEAVGWSNCPTTIVQSTRSGHSRMDFVLDRLPEPAEAQATGATTTATGATLTNSGSNWMTDLDVTSIFPAGFHALIHPGSLFITIPYAGGTVVALDDGATGAISASDGTTGWTNYSLNSMEFNPAASSSSVNAELGFTPGTTQDTYYFGYLACEVNTVCGTGLASGELQGATNLTTGSVLATSGTLCLGIPPVAAAEATPIGAPTNGCGQAGNPAMASFTINGGTTTVGALITAINASVPLNEFVVASLSAGPGGSGFCATSSTCFTVEPVAGDTNVVVTPAGSCTGSCATGITAAWITDHETTLANNAPRGEYGGSTLSGAQINDGYGVFGDSVNRGSGGITRMFSEVRAPPSAVDEVVGAADVGATNTQIQNIEARLWKTVGGITGKYAGLMNWDPNVLISFQTFHATDTGPNTAPNSTAYNSYLTGQQITQTLGQLGLPYLPGGECGLYQHLGFAGPHPNMSRGGSAKWGQCHGQAIRDAMLGTPDTWSAGPAVAAVATDYTTTYNARCSPTSGSPNCLDVVIALSQGDTAITLAGGITSASGGGPTGCIAGTVYNDGSTNSICLGSAALRVNSTSYPAGSIFWTPVSGANYGGNFLYQTYGPSGGCTSGTSPTTVYTSTSVFNQDASFGAGDGTCADLNFIGFALPYANSLALNIGQTFTNGGNAYEVVSTTNTSQIGSPCSGFLVNGIDQYGYSPTAGTNTGPTFACSIVAANVVQLYRASGAWGATPTLLYATGYPGTGTGSGNPYNTPTEQSNRGLYLNGNRGFQGATSPNFNTAPGMPLQPVVNSITAVANALCPQGTAVADGCSGAQAGSSFQQVAYFSGYAQQSGQGLYAARPSWNVPGVDYPVGPAGALTAAVVGTTLDAGLVAVGCSYNAGAYVISCPGFNNGAFPQHYDYTGSVAGGGQPCASLQIVPTAGGTITISNSAFGGGVCSAAGNDLISVTASAYVTNLVLSYSSVDGLGRFYPANLDAMVKLDSAGTFTGDYDVLLHAPTHVVAYTSEANSGTGNLLKHSYIEGFVYPPNTTHGEVLINGLGGSTNTIPFETYSFNLIMMPHDVYASCCTAGIYGSIGGGIASSGTVSAFQIDHNVVTCNKVGGVSPTSGCGLILSHGTFGSVTISNNYIDPTGAIWPFAVSGSANPLVTACTMPAVFSGNINMLSGAAITTWGANIIGSGC
jgi:hypothetical protein